MHVLPITINEFLTQLRNEFGVVAEVNRWSASTFIIHLQNTEVSFVFYRSLHYGCSHTLVYLPRRKVIHLDEDVYLSKKDIVITRLAAFLGKSKRVYARNTVLARINKREALLFQQEHHLQVQLPGKYRYGLFYKGELMSIAIFSGGRQMHAHEAPYRSFELLRFCHKAGYLVIGGLSKLIRGFVNEFEPNDVVTYVDRDWSDGKNYQQLGFTAVGIIPPQKFYIQSKTGRRYDKKSYQAIIEHPRSDESDSVYYTVDNLGSIKMRYIV
ncbi:hypothetical protein [Olivibacter domesticus]|uniref:Uncharacterized protein n=1 Tax=Olivibacter domesticus TaxID=407022 RepID=A0A1H7VII9_OLID1|nr:hypothetical protein [Olivibacter domesticus]SEM08844.1 hypothetical protein SAMN05661044_04197 [Olivibacter domesticus]